MINKERGSGLYGRLSFKTALAPLSPETPFALWPCYNPSLSASNELNTAANGQHKNKTL